MDDAVDDSKAVPVGGPWRVRCASVAASVRPPTCARWASQGGGSGCWKSPLRCAERRRSASPPHSPPTPSDPSPTPRGTTTNRSYVPLQAPPPIQEATPGACTTRERRRGRSVPHLWRPPADGEVAAGGGERGEGPSGSRHVGAAQRGRHTHAQEVQRSQGHRSIKSPFPPFSHATSPPLAATPPPRLGEHRGLQRRARRTQSCSQSHQRS